jgi:hypothetical protein
VPDNDRRCVGMNIRSRLPMPPAKRENNLLFQNKRLTLQLLRGGRVFSAAASRGKTDG